MGWLKQRAFITSRFWKLEVQLEVLAEPCPLKAPREDPCLLQLLVAAAHLGGPWGPLSLLCLSVSQSLPCRSLASLSSAYKDTSHWRATPSRLQDSLILIQSHLQRTLFAK